MTHTVATANTFGTVSSQRTAVYFAISAISFRHPFVDIVRRSHFKEIAALVIMGSHKRNSLFLSRKIEY